MSRDGYWDDQPEVSDSGRDSREGRRSRRSGRPDEQWLPDSRAGQDLGDLHSALGPGAGAAPEGYDPARYGDPAAAGYGAGNGYGADNGYGQGAGYGAGNGYDAGNGYG